MLGMMFVAKQRPTKLDTFLEKAKKELAAEVAEFPLSKAKLMRTFHTRLQSRRNCSGSSGRVFLLLRRNATAVCGMFGEVVLFREMEVTVDGELYQTF